MTPERLPPLVPLLAALLAAALAGCKAPQAFGDRNVVIVRAEPELWSRVDSAVMQALEQRVFTTRPERKFEVTFVASGDTLWNDLRLWQQIVVLGTAEDAVVRRILGAAGQGDAAPPALVRAGDIWARGQVVMALLLPTPGEAAAVGPLLPKLHSTLDSLYEDWIIQRMFTSGVNDSLWDALSTLGFALRLPKVYLHSQKDSIFRFGNPYRHGDTDLLRSVLLTWRTGLNALTPAALRAWRDSVGKAQYKPPQNILADEIRFDTIQVNGVDGLELLGVWQDNDTFPAAGPFVTRAVPCPRQNRTYYVDAWLFAPGTDKYPYLRQLEIVLDSFRCTEEGSTGTGAAKTGATADPASPAA